MSIKSPKFLSHFIKLNKFEIEKCINVLKKIDEKEQNNFLDNNLANCNI